MTAPTPPGLPPQPASGPTELPVPDTVDVREGPEVAHELLSLLPLLGEWHGEGQAAGSGGDHRFGQWVRFAHDGRGFLFYESRTWRLSDDGEVVGADQRETGFWRPRGEDEVEVLVASPAGLVEIYAGTARTTTSWELVSDVLARTPDHPDTSRATRLYGIVDGALMYAIDRAAGDQPLRPTMSARLERIR
ncbi:MULTISPECIES: FABP family protein [unclassified Modestobacter]